MPNEEKQSNDLTDAAKAEIAAAINILKSDGIHIHKTYAAFMKGQEKPPEGEEKSPEGDGEPPPKKEDENEPPKKKGLWWGDRE